MGKPSHFIALRIDSETIRNEFIRFHSHIQNNHPHVAQYLEPIDKLHLTLLTFHLPQHLSLEQAKLVFQQTSSFIPQFLHRSTRIQLKGIRSFGQRVVFASPVPTTDVTRLSSFVERLKVHFKDQGFTGMDSRKWVPHCTLMKGGEFHSGLYDSFRQAPFGSCSFATLDLCKIGSVGHDGYYERVDSVLL